MRLLPPIRKETIFKRSGGIQSINKEELEMHVRLNHCLVVLLLDFLEGEGGSVR